VRIFVVLGAEKDASSAKEVAMRWKQVAVAQVLILVALGAGCGPKDVRFSRDVHPILQKHCMSCHSPGGEGHAASGFSVVDYESTMTGTKFGPVIVPGSSISSTLVILVEHKADSSINMPRPTKRALAEHEKFLKDWKTPMLPADDINLIRDWIDAGAKNN
jgi:hypothetical protein